MLTVFQQGVLRAIAANRTPVSYIAGGAALNRDLPRLTGDIDTFHDVLDIVALYNGGFHLVALDWRG